MLCLGVQGLFFEHETNVDLVGAQEAFTWFEREFAGDVTTIHCISIIKLLISLRWEETTPSNRGLKFLFLYIKF